MMIGGSSSRSRMPGLAGEQVDEQQPVLQQLEELAVEADDAGVGEPGHVAQRGEQHVEALLVVAVAEVVEPGLGDRLARAARRRRARSAAPIAAIAVEDLDDLGRELRFGQVVDVDASAIRFPSSRRLLDLDEYNTVRTEMLSSPPSARPAAAPIRAPAGRPRDQRIDDAVLAATAELLARGGLRPAVDRRGRGAGRHAQAGDLPAVAVEGPAGPRGGVPRRRGNRLIPDTGDLRADLTSMVRGAVELFARPWCGPRCRACSPSSPPIPSCTRSSSNGSRTRSGAPCGERVAAATDGASSGPGSTRRSCSSSWAARALLALLTRAPDELDERLDPVDRVGPDGRNRTMTAPEREVTTAWHELLDGLRAHRRRVPRRRPRGPGRAGRRRRVSHGADRARRRPRHLPVRRSEPAAVRRRGQPGGAGPALGRRQHRQLVLASRRSIPHGPTGSAASGATAPTSASPSTTSRRRGSGRTASSPTSTTPTSTSIADGRFSFVIGPTRARRVRRAVRPARRRRRGRLHPRLPGRPLARAPGDVGDRGARPAGPARPASDEATAAALRAALRWVRTLFDIVPLAAGADGPAARPAGTTRRSWSTSSPSRTRSSDRATGGRRSTPCTAWRRSPSSRARRSSSPTGRPRAGSGTSSCGTPSWPPRRSRRPDLDQHRRRGAERRRHGHGRGRHDQLAHPNAISTCDHARARSRSAGSSPSRCRPGRSSRSWPGRPTTPT